jgi:uncharacterized protein (TIGR00369 family)
MTLEMDKAELQAFLHERFPQVSGDFVVETVDKNSIRLFLKPTDRDLRPGGTISGPTMFGLADVAVYLAILSRIGPVALAVTTNASIDFMRKPQAGKALVAEARVLKLGRLLVVGDVLIHSEGHAEPVARATLTYAIPPR